MADSIDQHLVAEELDQLGAQDVFAMPPAPVLVVKLARVSPCRQHVAVSGKVPGDVKPLRFVAAADLDFARDLGLDAVEPTLALALRTSGSSLAGASTGCGGRRDWADPCSSHGLRPAAGGSARVGFVANQRVHPLERVDPGVQGLDARADLLEPGRLLGLEVAILGVQGIGELASFRGQCDALSSVRRAVPCWNLSCQSP